MARGRYVSLWSAFPTNVQDTGQLSSTPELSNCINSAVRAPHYLVDCTCDRLFRSGLITILVTIALMTNFAAQTGNVEARLSFDFIYRIQNVASSLRFLSFPQAV